MTASARRGLILPIAALVLGVAAILALVVGGAFGRAPASPAPSDAPTAVATPTPTPTPVASPTPTARVDPWQIDLDNETDHDVSVDVDDETGSIVKLASGKPGDGMSVRWFDTKVENVDATRLKLTWVGLPRDEDVHLVVSDGPNGGYAFELVQAAPPPYSDAVGFDRILVLNFDHPVDASDVTVTVSEG